MEYEAKANELAEKFSNDESVFACAKEIAAFGRECAADALRKMALILEGIGDAGLDGTREMRAKRDAMDFAASQLFNEAKLRSEKARG